MSPRSYDSSSRERQAARTRHEIARIAVEQFVAHGYGATSMTAIAKAAGVSAQTVYNGFGTKAALLKQGYDLVLAGDGADVPLAERPEVRALYTDPDPVSFLCGYARLGRTVIDRLGPLAIQIAAGAASGDPDLVELRDTTDRERLIGTRMVVRRVEELGALAPGLDPDRARDRIWTLNSVEVWQLLTMGRGWSPEEYERWIGDAMCHAILARDRVTHP